MIDYSLPTFSYAGALKPEPKGFTRRQHILACLAGFALGAVLMAAAIL
ncbi:hypothetical protein [Rhizobium sp. Nf11,1]